MFGWLVGAVQSFIHQYGYAAVFAYMVLETSFLLHFVPSEVVVPFAAAELVHDPVSFVLFVVDTTVGSTVGSLLAYVLFGRYGREVLERYGHVVHVTEADLDRSQAVFVRYGESSVFWGRLLPLLRALISIPAGIAEMDLWRFTLYSAAGAGLFNTALTYLVYTGSNRTSPLGIAVNAVLTPLRGDVAYVRAHVLLVGSLAALLVLCLLVLWIQRDWLRDHPALAKRLALHAVRLVGVVVGTAFVAGALASPDRVFGLVTAVWDDPLFLVNLGFSERVALAFAGILVAFLGVLVYEVGEFVELAHVRAAVERTRSRFER